MFRDLDTSPKHSNVIYWADFIELKAFLDLDKCFSRGDLESVLEGDDGPRDRDSAGQRWREAINVCRNRSSHYGDSYPFSIDDDDYDSLFMREELQENHKVYLSLLLFSCLKYIDKSTAHSFARNFERLSLEAFKKLMPINSIFKPSWANPDEEDDAYTGHLAEKLRQIGSDIRCTTTAGIRDEDFNPRDHGDGGIDLVAWNNMNDEREGIPIAFGQCSCSLTEWEHKQIEASYARYSNYLPVLHPWANFYFCPLDLRRNNDTWHFRSDIGGAIIVDRSRFMGLISSNDGFAGFPIQIEQIFNNQLEINY